MVWRANLLVLAAATVWFSGCGASLVPVHGKVTLPGGKPAAGSQVVIDGESGGKKVSARGDVRDDGTFELGTFQPGDGAPPGKYRVQVNPPAMTNAEAPAVIPFNPKYNSFETSGLEFEAKPGGKNELPIQLTK